MAIWTRQAEPLGGLVHHSDRGGQYLSIRYTERLSAEGAVASVGSKGDDNAMAESINALYKSELIYNPTRGPWRTVEDVELATLGWVHWWNTTRLLEPIGHVPPVEFEQTWQQNHPLRSPERRWNVRGGMNMPAENDLTTQSWRSPPTNRASTKPGAVHRLRLRL
jgi:transposase InsO family protein